MVRIVVVFAFGVLLAACSGSGRIDDIVRKNPQRSSTQPAKDRLDSRSTAEPGPGRIAPETVPQEQSPRPQGASEE